MNEYKLLKRSTKEINLLTSDMSDEELELREKEAMNQYINELEFKKSNRYKSVRILRNRWHLLLSAWYIRRMNNIFGVKL